MYLSSKPAWFITTSGAVTWPPIGPDVTGGQDATGRAHNIPAHVCYDMTPKTSGILNFDANNCYANLNPPFAPPTYLRIIQ